MKRTFVYVDGFNLYYRALRKTRFKWLNIEALVQSLLEVDNVIEKIRYFTAPVSGKLDPGQPIRQQRYLDALRTLPTVTIHQGNFLTSRKFSLWYILYQEARRTRKFGTRKRRVRM